MKKNSGVIGFIIGFFKFIYILIYSFIKALTVDWYQNFNDKWNAKPKKKGYKKITAPDHIDYSKPKPDYKEVGGESSPADSAGAAGNVFDIFN